MVKECFQKSHPELQTPCFKGIAELTPCSATNCLVYERLTDRIALSDQADDIHHAIHHFCRMSYFGLDNTEFMKRKNALKVQYINSL